MRQKVLISVLLVALVGLLTTVALAQDPTNRAIIKLAKKVSGDGEVTFFFTPEGGDQMEIKVRVQKGVQKGRVADQLKREFEKKLDGASYEIKLNTEYQVMIKKKKAGSDFTLAMGPQTVPGLAISIK